MSEVESMIQNYVPLIHAIIDAMMFLECASDDDVDPHCAVRCLETMGSSLLKLSDADQASLRSEFAKIAESEEYVADKEFDRAIPDHIGLAT